MLPTAAHACLLEKERPGEKAKSIIDRCNSFSAAQAYIYKQSLLSRWAFCILKVALVHQWPPLVCGFNCWVVKSCYTHWRHSNGLLDILLGGPSDLMVKTRAWRSHLSPSSVRAFVLLCSLLSSTPVHEEVILWRWCKAVGARVHLAIHTLVSHCDLQSPPYRVPNRCYF